MKNIQKISLAAALLALSASAPAQQDQDTGMSFFVTSANMGKGGDLGGLAGADAHCSALAEAAGSSGKTWHAYLSVAGVNARDRIGGGPWYNAKSQLIALSVDDLHYNNMNLNKAMSLDENGKMINGRGDQPNQHDILTGSNADGTASDFTCENWTSSSESGSGMVGHHDRAGRGAMGSSWNSAHPSRGCSAANLVATGGNGYFYCFAID